MLLLMNGAGCVSATSSLVARPRFIRFICCMKQQRNVDCISFNSNIRNYNIHCYRSSSQYEERHTTDRTISKTFLTSVFLQRQQINQPTITGRSRSRSRRIQQQRLFVSTSDGTAVNSDDTGMGEDAARKESTDDSTTTTTSPTTSPSTSSRGIPLRQVIPRYVRLKFCDSDTVDIESDNEFDYKTYRPEDDPDLTQYVKAGYHGPNGNYDFTVEEMDKFDTKFFGEMVYNMLHKKRTRSNPSVKRAHHAWWKRMMTLQKVQDAYMASKGTDTNLESQIKKLERKRYRQLIDEYASDDGTCIDYYSTECQFTMAAIRECAINNYALPSDQESPMSLVNPEEVEERTFDAFEILYYDAKHSRTWKPLSELLDVMYYIRAERAIPLYVPKEYHKYVMEDDAKYWDQFRGLPEDDYDPTKIITSIDSTGIGDPTISNQERGRRIAALIRKYHHDDNNNKNNK